MYIDRANRHYFNVKLLEQGGYLTLRLAICYRVRVSYDCLQYKNRVIMLFNAKPHNFPLVMTI